MCAYLQTKLDTKVSSIILEIFRQRDGDSFLRPNAKLLKILPRLGLMCH